jgi:hypothetical protein
VRQQTLAMANTTPGIIAPGLTACVASTYLKVGLCQELSQRFVLEYCLKYKRKDVSLIVLSNPYEEDMSLTLTTLSSDVTALGKKLKLELVFA